MRTRLNRSLGLARGHPRTRDFDERVISREDAFPREGVARAALDFPLTQLA
jgi:hypothetical protein